MPGDFSITDTVLLLTVAALGLVTGLTARRLWRHAPSAPEKERQWTRALDAFDEPICLLDIEERIVAGNRAFYRRIKADPEEATGRKVVHYFHPEGEATPCPTCQARMERRDAVVTLESGDPRNHVGYPLEVTVRVVRDAVGEPIGFIQRMRDLTAARAIEESLHKSEARFRGLLESAPDPMVIVDSRGHITLLNSEAEKLFGYAREELIGRPVEVLVPQPLRERHSGLVNGYTEQPRARPIKQGWGLQAQKKDGTLFPVEISLSPMTTDEGTLTTAVVRDITRRQKEEQDLIRLATFPELSPTPIFEINMQGEPTFMNPVAVDAFPTMRAQKFEHPMLRGIESLFDRLRGSGEAVVRDVELGDRAYEEKITYIPDSQLIRVYSWDITEMRDMTRRMSYQASHDPLTGLVSRLEFERRLEQEIQSALFEASEHVVCYMDLDQFKVVNDTCGHVAGDALLKQLADEMRHSLRAADTLARLGGDEFGLILAGCPLPRAVEIANSLREVVSGFRFQWDDKAFMVGVSIGLVVVTRSSGSVTEVMIAADSACYVAKEQGRNRVHVYLPDDEIVAARRTMMDWTPRIQNALDQGRLEIDLQEIRPVRPGLNAHYEVLVRMRGEDGERIPPMAFIPAAERYQLMSRIDRWVVNHTLELMATPGYLDMYCAVNLSGQSLNDEGMLEFIVDAIGRHEVTPARLCFEITETAVVANLASARHFIQVLRGMGCHFSLDDFGSGLSSFGYLKSLPVDSLKIDGAIVRGVVEDTVSAAMVAAICQLGHVMGLKMIAEFVENEAIARAVQELGVDYVQGYGIARPVSPQETRRDAGT